MTFEQVCAIIALCIFNFVLSIISIIYCYKCFDLVLDSQNIIQKKLNKIQRRIK